PWKITGASSPWSRFKAVHLQISACPSANENPAPLLWRLAVGEFCQISCPSGGGAFTAKYPSSKVSLLSSKNTIASDGEGLLISLSFLYWGYFMPNTQVVSPTPKRWASFAFAPPIRPCIE